jgi:hypothetical protein
MTAVGRTTCHPEGGDAAGKAIAARLDAIRPKFAEHVGAGLIDPLTVKMGSAGPTLRQLPY